MLKSFDRYVLKEIASPFTLGLVVYTFTLLINMIFELSGTLISKDASLVTVSKILLYMLPDFLSFTIPMATLMGVLAGLSRMSTDSEVVAFRTMGISNFRLLKPIMIFAVMGWLASSWLIMYVTPEAGFQLNKLMKEVVRKRTASHLKPGKFYNEFPGYTLYFNDIDPQTNEWKQVFLYSRERGDTDLIIMADKGSFIHNTESNTGYIALDNAFAHSYKKKSPQDSFDYGRYKFRKEKIPGKKALKDRRRGRHMKFPDLVERLEMEPHNVSLAIEYHRKFSLPFTCIAMAFLALSLGISTKKGGKISGFIISLAIIFLYYTMSVSLENMVMKKSISPFLGMWGACFFLLVVGMIMYYFSSKEKTINWEFFLAITNRYKKMKLRRYEKRIARENAIIKANNQDKKGKKQTKDHDRVLFVIRFKPFHFRLRLFKMLDLYVTKKLVFAFFLVFTSIVLVFYIISVVELLDDVIEHKVDFIYVLKYLWHYNVEIISFALPVSVLTSVLLTFSVMSKNNEMIAVQVSGVSLYRLTLPAVILGLLLSGTYFYIQEQLMPGANKKKQEYLDIIHNRKTHKEREVNQNWVQGPDGTIFFYDFLDNKTNKILKFNILHMSKDFRILRRTSSQYARWVNPTELSLENGFERNFKNNEPTSFNKFNSKKIKIPQGKDLFTKKVSFPMFMNIKTLKRYIAYLKGKKSDTLKYEAQLYYKYAFPFSSLIMVLIAIPFSFLMGNKGTLFGIGIAIGVSMIFWFSFAVFSALGASAIISPFMSGFAPLFIFSIISVYLFMGIKT